MSTFAEHYAAVLEPRERTPREDVAARLEEARQRITVRPERPTPQLSIDDVLPEATR